MIFALIVDTEKMNMLRMVLDVTMTCAPVPDLVLRSCNMAQICIKSEGLDTDTKQIIYFSFNNY